MQKIISYPLSAVFYLIFGLLLVIFHPIQWFCFNVFGYRAHKISVDLLNGILIRSMHILGTRFNVTGLEQLPSSTPLIFAANHQSLYDIPPLIWFLRKYHPKFISKIELGKGIPSISYNLRHGGSVLIDRKSPRQSIPAIKQAAEYISKYKRSVIIFPEGTRSKDGIPKKFAENGLNILCKYATDAYLVPISIRNSWKMTRYGIFPLGLGNKLEFIIHKPIAIKDEIFEKIFEQTEQAVVSVL